MGEGTRIKRYLLTAEFYLAFTMPTLILAYGLVFLPFMLIALPYQPLSSIYMLLVVFFGACGVWSAFCLYRKVLNPEISVISAVKIRVGLFFGVLATVALFAYLFPATNSYTLGLFIILPVFVAAHFLWLSRVRRND